MGATRSTDFAAFAGIGGYAIVRHLVSGNGSGR
jgi:hypothetical protein